MKILIISMETWRSDTNGGNVLANIFEDFQAEFAQVYCSSGMPENNICLKYFQMTDGMAIQNILHKKKMGFSFKIDDVKKEKKEDIDNQILKIKKKGSFEILRVAREIVWALSDYKNQDLKKFVLDFDPDIIFAPCYGTTYMLSLTRYIAKLTNKPVISYISDDLYSLRQLRFSPIFWINRFVIRKCVRKTWEYYSLIYTMTSAQIQLMSKLGKPMKILCKSGDFNKELGGKVVSYPIRLIYAGGLYLDRWKTLQLLTDAMRSVGNNKFILDIYTGSALPKEGEKKLNDGIISRVHSSISYDQLMKEYKKSDIALHVESFNIKNRLNVRMSFSTKIIDCLDSGCAVMAICDKKQGGYMYLKEKDAAICVDSPKMIEKALKNILNNPQSIQIYREKALKCGRENHLKEKILLDLQNDFCNITNF